MSSDAIRALVAAFTREMHEAIQAGIKEAVFDAIAKSGPPRTPKQARKYFPPEPPAPKPRKPKAKKPKPAPSPTKKTDARVEQLPAFAPVVRHPVEFPSPRPKGRMPPIGADLEAKRKEARARKKAAIVAAVLATDEGPRVDPRGAGYVRRRRADPPA